MRALQAQKSRMPAHWFLAAAPCRALTFASWTLMHALSVLKEALGRCVRNALRAANYRGHCVSVIPEDALTPEL